MKICKIQKIINLIINYQVERYKQIQTILFITPNIEIIFHALQRLHIKLRVGYTNAEK